VDLGNVWLKKSREEQNATTAFQGKVKLHCSLSHSVFLK